MKHQIGRKKLNRKSSHTRSMLRNQVIHLITYGQLISTAPRVKEVQKFAEKLVTLARQGNTFNVRRRALSLLPYKKQALDKLFVEIAPTYATRAGGYTRIVSLGRRTSDTAPMSKLEWV
jgi:large subunit ribosomal protein L17